MNYRNLILLSGHSRSGTTLSCAILDSHPEIAMSFEVVPDPFDAPIATYRQLIDSCVNRFSKHNWELHAAAEDYQNVSRYLTTAGGRTFSAWVGRCRRSALDLEDVHDILGRYNQKSECCNNQDERIELATQACHAKMVKFGRVSCGFKASARDIEYVTNGTSVRSPLRTIFLIRNPLDVFASTRALNWVNFDVDRFVKQWTGFYNRVEKITERRSTLVLKYEDLISDQERIGESIRSYVGLASPLRIGSYHERSTATNISAIQITKGDLWRAPITDTRIRRWEQILSASDVAVIRAKCGAIMCRFGYDV